MYNNSTKNWHVLSVSISWLIESFGKEGLTNAKNWSQLNIFSHTFRLVFLPTASLPLD